MQTIDLAILGLSFAAGDQIAISLGTPSAIPDIRWATSTDEPYELGSLYRRSVNPLQPWESLPIDSAFRTYVEPIPEPSSGLLLGVGLTLGALLRALRSGGSSILQP